MVDRTGAVQGARGKLTRHYCQKEFEPLGIDSRIRQTNLSENFKKHTLRGVHYQGVPTQEAKTMSCLIGAIHNITVDLRPTSPTFLQWESEELNDRANLSLHVPAGCAIGYLTLEERTMVFYYMSDFYDPDTASGFRYDDPFFDFDWPAEPQVISDRELNFAKFDAQEFKRIDG